MFVHHVFFWLKEPQNQEAYNTQAEGLRQLSTIGTIKMVHIGKPATTERDVIDGSYTFSLLTVFDTEADHDIYQEDPIHLKFIADCKHLWKKVLVYDSE
jgi:hypothetical protein